MKPTEELVHEHQVITLVLNAVTLEAGRLRNAGKIDPGLVEKMLDFFRNFTDGCHHAKEEKHLFPLLERRGMPRDRGPVGVMLAEHDEGRRLVSNIGGVLPAAARGDRVSVWKICDEQGCPRVKSREARGCGHGTE